MRRIIFQLNRTNVEERYTNKLVFFDWLSSDRDKEMEALLINVINKLLLGQIGTGWQHFIMPIGNKLLYLDYEVAKKQGKILLLDEFNDDAQLLSWINYCWKCIKFFPEKWLVFGAFLREEPKEKINSIDKKSVSIIGKGEFDPEIKINFEDINSFASIIHSNFHYRPWSFLFIDKIIILPQNSEISISYNREFKNKIDFKLLEEIEKKIAEKNKYWVRHIQKTVDSRLYSSKKNQIEAFSEYIVALNSFFLSSETSIKIRNLVNDAPKLLKIDPVYFSEAIEDIYKESSEKKENTIKLIIPDLFQILNILYENKFVELLKVAEGIVFDIAMKLKDEEIQNQSFSKLIAHKKKRGIKEVKAFIIKVNELEVGSNINESSLKIIVEAVKVEVLESEEAVNELTKLLFKINDLKGIARLKFSFSDLIKINDKKVKSIFDNFIWIASQSNISIQFFKEITEKYAIQLLGLANNEKAFSKKINELLLSLLNRKTEYEFLINTFLQNLSNESSRSRVQTLKILEEAVLESKSYKDQLKEIRFKILEVALEKREVSKIDAILKRLIPSVEKRGDSGYNQLIELCQKAVSKIIEHQISEAFSNITMTLIKNIDSEEFFAKYGLKAIEIFSNALENQKSPDLVPSLYDAILNLSIAFKLKKEFDKVITNAIESAFAIKDYQNYVKFNKLLCEANIKFKKPWKEHLYKAAEKLSLVYEFQPIKTIFLMAIDKCETKEDKIEFYNYLIKIDKEQRQAFLTSSELQSIRKSILELTSREGSEEDTIKHYLLSSDELLAKKDYLAVLETFREAIKYCQSKNSQEGNLRVLRNLEINFKLLLNYLKNQKSLEESFRMNYLVIRDIRNFYCGNTLACLNLVEISIKFLVANGGLDNAIFLLTEILIGLDIFDKKQETVNNKGGVEYPSKKLLEIVKHIDKHYKIDKNYIFEEISKYIKMQNIFQASNFAEEALINYKGILDKLINETKKSGTSYQFWIVPLYLLTELNDNFDFAEEEKNGLKEQIEILFKSFLKAQKSNSGLVRHLNSLYNNIMKDVKKGLKEAQKNIIKIQTLIKEN